MLDPAGIESARVMGLFWICAGVALCLLAAGIGLMLYAVRRPPVAHAERVGRRLIVMGGVGLPLVLLALLTVVGLRLMVELRSNAGDLTVRVTGEQFWWRVEYLADDGSVTLETANEIHLPVNVPVTLELLTADVIHSFWVPALAGKVDMMPGQRNRLVVEATRTGRFRGQCAEFCGDSHALMAFSVVVDERNEFDHWLARQGEAAAVPGPGRARRGQDAFQGYGCGACHRVRGSAASGRLGPDLTHVASRSHVAAGTLPTDEQALGTWLRHTQRLKPGAQMPDFHMMADAKLDAIVAYLLSLE